MACPKCEERRKKILAWAKISEERINQVIKKNFINKILGIEAADKSINEDLDILTEFTTLSQTDDNSKYKIIYTDKQSDTDTDADNILNDLNTEYKKDTENERVGKPVVKKEKKQRKQPKSTKTGTTQDSDK